MNKQIFFAQNRVQVVMEDVTFTVKEYFLDPDNAFADTEVGNLANITVEIVGEETKTTNASGQASFTLADGTYDYKIYKMDAELTTEVGEIVVSGVTNKTVKLYECLYTPNQVENMINPPAWVAGTYAEGFMVVNGGIVYVANAETSEEPPHADWTVTDRFIPVATADELDDVINTTTQTMGAGTIFEASKTTGNDKKYIQVRELDTVTGNKGHFIGTYDGNELFIKNITVPSAGGTNNNALFRTGSCIFKNMILQGTVAGGSVLGLLMGKIDDTTQLPLIDNVIAITEALAGQTGGIVGQINNGVISNCKGFYKTEFGRDQGAIVSSAIDSEITNCEGVVDYISNTTTSTVTTECGGIAGIANNTIISKCKAKLKARTPFMSDGVNAEIGGIVGRASVNSQVNECEAEVDIISNGNRAAGIVGFPVTGATVNNCRANGSIVCYSVVAGVSWGSVTNSYYSGTLEKTNPEGFLSPVSYGTVINSYFDKDVMGIDTPETQARTTDQMKEGTEDSFILPEGGEDTGEDPDNAMYQTWLTTIWDFGLTTEYPKLQWENT